MEIALLARAFSCAADHSSSGQTSQWASLAYARLQAVRCVTRHRTGGIAPIAACAALRALHPRSKGASDLLSRLFQQSLGFKDQEGGSHAQRNAETEECGDGRLA